MQGHRLSPQQRRLWSHVKGDPQPYRSIAVVALEGKVDQDVLAAALSDVVARHEILRTSFECPDAIAFPLQVIHAPEPVALEVIDDDDRAGGDPLRAALALLNRAAHTAGPSPKGRLRAVLDTSPECGTLLLEVPALCADGAALDVVVDELARSYAARLGGGTAQGEAYQYADLAAWQNDLVDSADEPGVAFWRGLDLAGRIDWSLPQESGEVSATFDTKSITRELDDDTTAALGAAADRIGIEIADLLLTGWIVLLRRRANRPDGVVGVLHDGRGYEELQHVPGLFARYLPFDSVAEPGESVAGAARRFSRRSAEFERWQDYFTSQCLTAETGKPQGYAFCFEYARGVTPRPTDGLTFRVVDRAAYTDRFKLGLRCREAEGSIHRGKSERVYCIE